MRFAFGVFSSCLVVGLVMAAPVRADDVASERAGIERVQEETDTRGKGPGAHPQAEADRKGGSPDIPDAGRSDGARDGRDGEGDAETGATPPSGIRPPPGCIYREEPLGLIV